MCSITYNQLFDKIFVVLPYNDLIHDEHKTEKFKYKIYFYIQFLNIKNIHTQTNPQNKIPKTL